METKGTYALLLGLSFDGLASHLGGSSNTPSRLTVRKAE